MNRNFARMTRRDFLRLASVGGLLVAVPLLRYLPGSRSSPTPSFQRSTYAMGTTVSIVVEDEPGLDILEAATSSAFDEVKRLEGIFTAFRTSSEVSRLNAMAELGDPADEMAEVIAKSIRLSETTEGAFDVTVKPALDLFATLLQGGPLPTDADFEATRSLIGFESVALAPHSVSLSKRGMGVTLDGIAGGYILDRAASRLRSFGVRSALVQAGGTIVALGSRSDGSPWKVGIRDPLDEYGTVGTLSLKDQAVATTGDYENFFTPDRRFYHVVDPSTARSPLYSHSATVVAPTAFEADPLGVTLMVKTPIDGLRMVDGLKGYECVICARDGSKVVSPGLEVSQ